MSVRDAALMMNVLKQPDARDWTSLPPDGRDYTASAWTTASAACASPTRRRWAMRKNVHPEVAAAVRRGGAASCEALGAQVEQVDPGIDDPLDITHRAVVRRRLDACGTR